MCILLTCVTVVVRTTTVLTLGRIGRFGAFRALACILLIKHRTHALATQYLVRTQYTLCSPHRRSTDRDLHDVVLVVHEARLGVGGKAEEIIDLLL